jgi:hypothetical protein
MAFGTAVLVVLLLVALVGSITTVSVGLLPVRNHDVRLGCRRFRN